MSDPDLIIEQLDDGARALHDLVGTWPSPVQEAHIIGAERSLVGLQVLLAQLRRHTQPQVAA